MTRLFLTLFSFILICSCSENDEDSDGIEISIQLTTESGEEIPSTVFKVVDNQIHIMVPTGSDLSAVVPIISLSGSTVIIDKGQQPDGTYDLSDFTSPLSFRFIHRKKVEQEWKLMLYDLPVLMITTPDGQPITSKEVRTEGCMMQLVNTDGTMEELGTAGIRGRGQTSWIQDKKPYNIKLDQKCEILGMDNSKHWILLANCYYDRTQLHNDVAFEMARMTDYPWVQEGRFVELFFNGRHQGLYYLCEKVRVEKGKIEITEMTPEDISGEALTGGYLVESYVDYGNYSFDGYPFQTDFFNRTGYNGENWLAWEIKEPDSGYIIPQEQFDYIVSAMNQMESLIYDDDKLLSGVYRDYFDIETAINWYLIEEAAANEEACRTKNVILYKDRGGKFQMGPPWDFDAWSFGHAGLDASFCSSWSLYYQQLLKDPVFVSRLKEKWNTYISLWWERIPEHIDSRMSQICRSAKRNEQMWPKWTEENMFPYDTYEECVQKMKHNYLVRLGWLNDYISNLPD